MRRRSRFLEELVDEDRRLPLDAETALSTSPRRLLRRGRRPIIDGAVFARYYPEQTEPVFHGHTAQSIDDLCQIEANRTARDPKTE